MTIGKRIVALRAAKGLDQKTLAELAGINQGHLSAIEAGKVESPRMKLLSKLAAALEVPVSSFTGDEAGGVDGESLEWFWRKTFALFKPSDVLRFRSMSPAERSAWSLQRLLEAYEPSEIAARMQLPLEHLTQIAHGTVEPSETVIDILASEAEVPENWLLNGNPGAPDPILRDILQHRDSGVFLSVIKLAIDAGIAPELLKRQLDLMISLKGIEKPPAQ